MTEELRKYTNYCERLIKSRKVTDEDIKIHLTKIEFFQHERQIHLFVTLAFALFVCIFILLTTINACFIFVVLFLTIFLICYVIHYYHLENGVQYLYKQYDKMIEIRNNKSVSWLKDKLDKWF